MSPKGKGKRKSKTGNKNFGSISSKCKPTERGVPIDLSIIPLDTLMVKIYSLQVTDDDPYKQFNIQVCLMDQLICNANIASISSRDKNSNSPIAEGLMYFDPADQDKMCMVTDYPMTVLIYPASKKRPLPRATGSGEIPHTMDEDEPINIKNSDLINKLMSKNEVANISCCNIDILPLFIEKDRMFVRKRLEPMVKRSALFTSSWCNLPLLSMEISMILDHSNEQYHRLYHHANYMTVTLVGAYNLGIPFHEEFHYVAASKIAQGNENHSTTIIFEGGEEQPKAFSSLEFYPHWESLRSNDDIFTGHDVKWMCGNGLDDIQNDDNINLNFYLNRVPSFYSVVWGSFHRGLMTKSTEDWLQQHICRWRWPLEIHVNHEYQSYDYMAFLDLFKLLYPGEQTVRMAVPLLWWSFSEMMESCDCPPLLPTNEKLNDKASSILKSSRKTEDTYPTTQVSEDTVLQTGADGNPAFVIVEVKLARPLVEVKLPPVIPNTEIDDMMMEIENDVSRKRPFTGRGQLDQDWQRTVLSAIAALRKVPYHGSQDIIYFMRQLAQNRVKLEVFTSFWQEAAVYVNNNFLVKNCMETESQYQEMLTAAFSCMMRLTVDTVFGRKPNALDSIDPVLRAARHARQMQDRAHAKDLYLYLLSRNPENADYWREFGNTMKYYKRNWARICNDKAVFLNPRHPLTLIAKGCIVGDHEAEIFFNAVLAMYPFWYTGWVIISTYYWQREMYELADAILRHIKHMESDQVLQEVKIARAWEHELGDWWDHTPILPGMSAFYDATDLLLRLRALTLAKTCLARALLDRGETPQYYHLMALCCRLNGNTKDALCLVTEAIDKYGEISYLRTLQGECYHLMQEIDPAMAAFEKAGTCAEAYSLLLSMPCREVQRARSYLVDLVRRHPCSYTWMGLADDWMMRSRNVAQDPDDKGQDDNISARTCAAACAIQALKWDRLCGRAWALLSLIVPVPARRSYYSDMAEKCGYVWKRKEIKNHYNLLNRPENECHRVATALHECRCKMCFDVRESCK